MNKKVTFSSRAYFPVSTVPGTVPPNLFISRLGTLSDICLGQLQGHFLMRALFDSQLNHGQLTDFILNINYL